MPRNVSMVYRINNIFLDRKLSPVISLNNNFYSFPTQQIVRKFMIKSIYSTLAAVKYYSEDLVGINFKAIQQLRDIKLCKLIYSTTHSWKKTYLNSAHQIHQPSVCWKFLNISMKKYKILRSTTACIYNFLYKVWIDITAWSVHYKINK